MKLKTIASSIGLALLLVFGASGAEAQMVNPLGLGALGAGLGYLAGGNAAGAAIGGVAGVGAGMLLNASQGSGGYGYYAPAYRRPVYVSGYYGPGYRGYYRPHYVYRHHYPGYRSYHGHRGHGPWR